MYIVSLFFKTGKRTWTMSTHMYLYFFVSDQILDILISMEKAEYFCSYIIFYKTLDTLPILMILPMLFWFISYKDFWKVFFLAIIVLGFCRDIYVIVPTPTLFLFVCNDIYRPEKKRPRNFWPEFEKIISNAIFHADYWLCWEISGLKKLQKSFVYT